MAEKKTNLERDELLEDIGMMDLPQVVVGKLTQLLRNYKIYIPPGRLLDELLIIYLSGKTVSVGFRGGVFLTLQEDGTAKVTIGPLYRDVSPIERVRPV